MASKLKYYAAGTLVMVRGQDVTDATGKITGHRMGYLAATAETDGNAQAIAGLMNRGEAFDDMLHALKEAKEELYDRAHSHCDPDDESVADSTAFTYRTVRDAIAKAEAA